MCGIAGWISYKEDLSSQSHILEKMSQTLANRGPDASGSWFSAHAAIVHRRLIVVDPAGGGQPMMRRRGEHECVITYNGELYNTLDLRLELESLGHVFQSNSDTEVLLMSYIEWGEGCVERLNGIFAFAIWDEGEQKLFMARDRFGVKPLFFTRLQGSFIFGSEIKAILAHPGVKPEIDSEGLAEVFALGPARSPGHGVFRGIYEVKPAQCLIYDRGGLRLRRYWSLKSNPHSDDLDTTVEKVRSLVKDAIVRQLVADVPVCTFLSGGLDSSGITAYAAGEFNKKGMQALNTYSIDYAGNEVFFKPNAFQPNSDAHWISQISGRYGTTHHNVIVDTPFLAQALVEAVKAKDLPGMADIDSSLWLFCREVKKDATVALSGECADEVFGGYPWFHREEMLNANTFPWSRDIRSRIGILSPEMYHYISPAEYIGHRYMETLEEVPRLPGENPADARRREMFYLNLTWFMTTLLDRKDRMSMAHGLEVRVPYCDHRLVEYVWNIPWEMKVTGGMEKGILRKALEGVLPEGVLYRKKSPYPKTHNPSYEKAVAGWLLEILNDASSPLLPLINVEEVKRMTLDSSDYGSPWFGQLMAKPQMYAYLIQVDTWLREYRVSIL